MCRDSDRAFDFALPKSATLTSNPLLALEHPRVDMIVEVMGGTDTAAKVLLDAAQRGKHVVTANKALLAARLPAIEAAFSASAGRLGYEAAVAGGVPVIRVLSQALALDNFSSIRGVLNGTTNFMLTAMHEQGAEYGAVLSAAQTAGFAEADPTADVEGHDARNKLAILTRLAFGVATPVSHIRTQGITGVGAGDFAFAKDRGATIKLVASASRDAEGEVETFVSPAVVARGSPLGSTDGAMNIVQCDTAFLGVSSLYGAGAGRYPTALSVVADMVNIALDEQARLPFPRPLAVGVAGKHSRHVTSPWCVHTPGEAAASSLASYLASRGVACVGSGGVLGRNRNFVLTAGPVSSTIVDAALERSRAAGSGGGAGFLAMPYLV